MIRGTRSHPTALRLVAVLAALVPVTLPAAAEPLEGEGLLARTPSVALEDDGGAVLYNPAGLGWATRSDLFMVLTDIRGDLLRPGDDKNRTLAAAGLQLGPFGAGYERVDMGASTRAHHWTLGLRLQAARWMALGVTTSHLSQRSSSAWRHGLGLLVRPHDAVSLGATARDLNQPSIGSRRIHRSYRLGLGLRPLAGAARERLTLFADAHGVEDARWPAEARISAGLRAEVLPGISITTALEGVAERLDEEQFWSAGLAVQFLSSRVEVNGSRSSESDRTDVTSFGVHFSPDRPRSLSRRPVLAKVRVGGRLADEATRGLPVPIPLLGSRSEASVHPVLEQLERARTDPNVRGVLLEVDPVSGASLIEEIGDAIHRVREEGKPVVAYLEEGGSHNGYGLAAACDRIVLAPRGALYLLGIRTDILYQGEMLDSLGLRVERITSGRYKSAYERYERPSASPGFREQIESIFDDRWARWVDGVAGKRDIPRDSLLALADGRVIRGDEAVPEGLVDAIGTRETARELLEELSGGDARIAYVGGLQDRRYHWGPRPVVAIYYMNGFVNVGRSRKPLFGDGVLGAESVERDLRALAADPSVAAVVLRVDSGGGLGLAGTLMRRAVLDLEASGKPVVVSMGRVAASAAYHFSAAADLVLAQPGTITGSIGVIVVRPDYARLLEKVRVHPETFQRGDLMGLWSYVRPLDEAERRMARDWVAADYEDFLADVAEDRGMTRDEAHEVAQGRVWTGAQAVERGLVDELGGLADAVDRARELAGLDASAEVRHLKGPGRGLAGRLLGALTVTPLLEMFSLSRPPAEEPLDEIPVAANALLPWISQLPFLNETVGSLQPLEYSPIGSILANE